MSFALRRRIASGIGWNFANQAMTQVITLSAMIVLARRLTPDDYGVVGMVIAFTGFASIFVNLGLTPAVIQKQDATQSEMSTVFWTNNGMGWLIFLLFWLLAKPIAVFYGTPALVWVTRVSALTFCLSPLAAMQQALLLKALRFRAVAVINLVALGISTSVAVVLALWDFGYWSLVVQTLVLASINAVVLWILVGWRPSFVFDTADIRRLFGFSGYVTVTEIVAYWSRNLEKLIVGRVLGTAALGIYSRAFTLMLMPIQQVSRVVGAVLFPAFSSIQNDPKQIAEIYLKITRLVALLTFPLSFGLWAVAEPAVLVVYGPRWADVIPILKILCPLGAIQSILNLNGSLYLSQGKSRRSFVVVAAFMPLVAASWYLGLKIGGLAGMCWAYFFLSAVTAPIIYWTAASLVGLHIVDMVKNLGGVTFATFVMTMSLVSLNFPIRELPSWGRLFIMIPAGVFVYVITLHVFKVGAYIEASRLIQSRLLRKKTLPAVSGLEQAL